MKVFITGGAGFIGSHLTREFLDLGHEVTTYDAYSVYTAPTDTFVENLTYRRSLREGSLEIWGSTLDISALRAALDLVTPDVIVHMAALPIANVCQRSPHEAYENIVTGTANILQLLHELKFSGHFTYISSSMVYGDFQQDPNPEEAPLAPKGVYGTCKLAGEVLVQGYGRFSTFSYSIVRPISVYGPGDTNYRVVQIFLEKALRGEPITVFEGNDNRMDFTYVTDTANGIYLAATHPHAKGRIFNISRGKDHSLDDLVNQIGTYVKVKVTHERDKNTFRPKRGALDIQRAMCLLEYTPRVDLDLGIGMYIDYMLEHNSQILEVQS